MSKIEDLAHLHAVTNEDDVDYMEGDAAEFCQAAYDLMPSLLEIVRWAGATLEWAQVCFPEYADVEVCNELNEALEALK